MIETYDLPTWDPLYLVRSRHRCSACEVPADVVALVAERYDEYLEDPAESEGALAPLGWLHVALLTPVVGLSAELRDAIQAVALGYRPGTSQAGMEAFSNHCACGAVLSDEDVYGPGGAFDVDSAEDVAARRITVVVLPIRGLQRIVCDLVAQDGIELIHELWWRGRVDAVLTRLYASAKPAAFDHAVALTRALACLRKAESDLESWKRGVDPLPPPTYEEDGETGEAARNPRTDPGSSPNLLAWDPLYVISSTNRCWRCGSISPVAGLLVERWIDLSEGRPGTACEAPPDETQYVVMPSNIELLPEELERSVRQFAPGFRRDHSRTIGSSYFMNHCISCDARFGDFFLGEVDGPFWATTPEEIAAKGIVVRPLRVTGMQALRCGYSASGALDRIHEHWWHERVWRLRMKLEASEEPEDRACGVALERALGELSYVEREIDVESSKEWNAQIERKLEEER